MCNYHGPFAFSTKEVNIFDFHPLLSNSEPRASVSLCWLERHIIYFHPCLNLQTKEDEVVDLSDKLGKAKVNEAQLETRTNSEIRKLTREMELVKEQHRQEVCEL